MNLRVIGCNFRTATVEVREKLAFNEQASEEAVPELRARYGVEAALLSTCNRVELYVGKPDGEGSFDLGLAAEFLAESRQLAVEQVVPILYEHTEEDAVRHLCRVTSSLDSLIVGEGQIASQVKQAYEQARRLKATGPLLNKLFPHALRAAKRVRNETGISHGHVSVSSVAVDYVRQVFDHFNDKTVLVIGAGKMGRLTLKHLQELKPGRILVANRSPEKAREVAALCGGQAVDWAKLDPALAEADIALSTTGANELVMSRQRFDSKVRPFRKGGTLVVLDIAVPRDFDPDIHDGDEVYVFNIDDLTRVREQTLAERRAHIGPAEVILEEEVTRFLDDWRQRAHGPLITQLRVEVDKLRSEVSSQLHSKLNGKLTEEDRKAIDYHFQLFQGKILHGPIAALQEASREGKAGVFSEVIRKLFGLNG